MATSYWCYICNSFVQMHTNAATCPKCRCCYVEQMDEPVQGLRLPIYEHQGFRGPTFPDDNEHLTSPFNPVIALRRRDSNNKSYFELYYSLGMNIGLRKLPVTASNLLKVNGLDLLLGQLLRIDASELGQVAPADADDDSMRNITIESRHIDSETHCVICTDPFELGTEAQQMPCGHVYHEDCISRWLSSKKTCPVCRYQMPTDGEKRGGALRAATIWRMSGGKFAVGNFAGTGRHGIDRPVMYTESDGSFNYNVHELQEIPRNTGRKSRFAKFIQKIFGCFGPTSSN